MRRLTWSIIIYLVFSIGFTWMAFRTHGMLKRMGNLPNEFSKHSENFDYLKPLQESAEHVFMIQIGALIVIILLAIIDIAIFLYGRKTAEQDAAANPWPPRVTFSRPPSSPFSHHSRAWTPDRGS